MLNFLTIDLNFKHIILSFFYLPDAFLLKSLVCITHVLKRNFTKQNIMMGLKSYPLLSDIN